MKNAVIPIIFIIGFLAGFVVKSLIPGKKAEAMAENKHTDRKPDEDLIRKTEASYDAAWQQGNLENLIACFTDDAVLISPRGDQAFGKAEIRKLLSNFLSKEASGSKHTSRIIRITFVNDDVAVVDGEAFIESAEKLSAAVRHHRFIDILVRRENSWLISQIRAFAVNE